VQKCQCALKPWIRDAVRMITTARTRGEGRRSKSVHVTDDPTIGSCQYDRHHHVPQGRTGLKSPSRWELNLAKVGVEGSNPFARSSKNNQILLGFSYTIQNDTKSVFGANWAGNRAVRHLH
jgi:hypothetical protein